MEAIFKRAQAFYEQYYAEKKQDSARARLEEIRRELEHTGTYWQHTDELEYGARLAWRNSNRCVGRLFWKTLKIQDMRHVQTEEAVFDAIRMHLNNATNAGNIRSVITLFKPEHPLEESFRIWNTQIVRYAGYENGAVVLGDPSEVAFTRQCQRLGWQGAGTPFDILPVVIQKGQAQPKYFELPSAEVLEVPLAHPSFPWFESLHLKWYAVPIISSMALEVGGLIYPAAPFNGWYMSTEVAARNLGDTDRYNILPVIARQLNLDTSKNKSLWKDRALLELNAAVLYSYEKAGVRLVDHHTAAEQFIHFTEAETRAGREVQADWSWIVPPVSGSAVPTFHRSWSNQVHVPNFFYSTPPWVDNKDSVKRGCPFHRDSLERV